MRIQFFVLLLGLSFFANAQQDYSYINERLFKDPSDLVGYSFRPHRIDIPGNYEPTKIEAGSYSFGISANRMYVIGDKTIGGLYEISTIEPARYGYKVNIINPRNPSNQGHLKVILNQYSEAEAVIFKKTGKATEMIFHLPDQTQNQLKEEKAYYTDRGEVPIPDIDSLWGTTVHPFFRINTYSDIQSRLYVPDSTTISFEKIITVKEKKKKPKKKKRKKKKKEEKKPAEKEAAVDEIIVGETIEEDIWIEDKEYVKPAPKSKETEEKNKKVFTNYFVIIRTILTKEDGSKEKVEWKYPVKNIDEREDSSAGKNEERYQLAIKVKKKKEIYLYLNGDRTISSFEADGVLYLMRGH